jgi:hypothetical protein
VAGVGDPEVRPSEEAATAADLATTADCDQLVTLSTVADRQPGTINSDYNDFVERVALEVVDSAWWKLQLRVKSAGSDKTALSSNEGAIATAVIHLREFLCQPVDPK